jgi:hypothetical protein
MLFRPRFTYIRVASDQERAREAAANEEWRKKLLFHQTVVEPYHPGLILRGFPKPETFYHRPRPEYFKLPPPLIIKKLPVGPIIKPETYYHSPDRPFIVNPIPPLLQNNENSDTSPSPPQNSRPTMIVASAATSQNSQPSSPFSAIGSFFSGLASGVENAGNALQNFWNAEINAAKEAGSAVTGALETAGNAISNALSAANNAIQNAYASAYGIQTPQQQEQQLQQQLNGINQEKQQLQQQLNQVNAYILQTEQNLQQAQQYQAQAEQEQQQLQQQLNQVNAYIQQTEQNLQQAQQYQAQAEQLLQQNPNNPQLQSYLNQIQQYIQQTSQDLTQAEQEQQQLQQQLNQVNAYIQQNQQYIQQTSQDLTQLEQTRSQIEQDIAQLNQAQQQIQQGIKQLQNQQSSSNPFQQFFNDVAEGSALVGYYLVEGAGGAGWELGNLVQGKGLENFSQAVAQFNAAGGQNIARAAGDVTEVALPAIVTGIVAPELLPAVIIGEGASVGIGEVASKLTTGQWQSLPEVLQEANEGGILGLIGGATGSALEGGLVKLGTTIGGGVGDFLAGAGGRALAGAAVNEALTVPFTRNPEQLLLAGVLGAAGGAAGELVSKVPWLEQSEYVRNAIDTSEAGAKLGNELVNEGITKGVLTPDEISGKTTTQLGDLLREKYSTLSNQLIKSLDKDTVENLKEKAIITDTQVLKPDEFIKAVKDKVPEDKLQLFKDTTELVEKYNEGIKKLVGGWKFRIGNRTLLYRLKLGDVKETGFGSAGKSNIFNDIRTVNDIEANVAGIYNNPSDVRDTMIALENQGSSEEAQFLERLYEAAKAIKSPLSKLKPNDEIELSLRDLENDRDIGPAKAQILAQTIKDYFENEVGGRKVIIYGSNSVKQYLQDIANRLGATLDTTSDDEYYLIKRGGKVEWKWRRPGDVDAFINTDNPNDLDKIAQDLADRMNKAIGTNRFKAEGHLVIDVKTGNHIVDLHMPNEPSDYFNLYANESTGADLGIQRPTPNYADLGVAKVSQIALDKANASAGLREVSLNDLLNEINSGTKIDNYDYIVYLAKQILRDKDPETVKDVLSEFLGEIHNDNLRDYLLQRFSQEFNIPESELIFRPWTRIGPQIRGDIEQILNERYRYLAPASYRFKDAQDFLTLLKLASELTNNDELEALYEQLRSEFEERGLIPKGWEPNQLDWNTIQNAQRLANSLSSAGGTRSLTFFTSPVTSLGGGSAGSGGSSNAVSIKLPSITSLTSTTSPPSLKSIGGSTSSTTSTTTSSTSTTSTTSITSSGGSESGGSTPPTTSPPPGNSYEYTGGSPPPSPYWYGYVSWSQPPSYGYIYPSPSPSPSPPSSSSTSDSTYYYYYIQSESLSPPSVFSSSIISPSESPLPMGPPPLVPSTMPGGFGGGGGNNLEVSGMAGEVIYL